MRHQHIWVFFILMISRNDYKFVCRYAVFEPSCRTEPYFSGFGVRNVFMALNDVNFREEELCMWTYEFYCIGTPSTSRVYVFHVPMYCVDQTAGLNRKRSASSKTSLKEGSLCVGMTSTGSLYDSIRFDGMSSSHRSISRCPYSEVFAVRGFVKYKSLHLDPQLENKVFCTRVLFTAYTAFFSIGAPWKII